MMHPFAAVTGSFDEDLESWVGPSGQSIYSMQFYETNRDNGFVRGAKWQVKPAGGPLGTRAHMSGKPLEESWGPRFHRNTKTSFGRSFEWGIIAEDLPDNANRVELDSALTDSDGVPSPKIRYRTSDNTTKLLAFHVERVKEAMRAANASNMVESPLMRDCGWHLMGTARMGHDPENSVVDQYGRCHDIPNLFIFDGSTFVTSSGVNPTATVAAVALRATEHLIGIRRDLYASAP